MATEDVIKGIYDKGNLERESIRKSAEQQVSKILEDASSKAKKIIDDGKGKIIKDLELEKMRKISMVNVELKREYMDLLNKIMDEYLDKIKEYMKELRNNQLYRDYIKRSIEKGLQEIGINENDSIIYISEIDKSIVDNKNAKFSKDLDELGGVIISTKDGKIFSDKTIKNLIEEKKLEIKEKFYVKVKEEL